MHDIWKCTQMKDFRIHQFNHSFGPFVVLELWNNKNLHVSHNFSVDILYYFSQTNRITANCFIMGYIEEMQKELFVKEEEK